MYHIIIIEIIYISCLLGGKGGAAVAGAGLAGVAAVCGVLTGCALNPNLYLNHRLCCCSGYRCHCSLVQSVLSSSKRYR